MLDKLRRGVAKVLLFGLLGILVLSFAVWGIGDVVRTGGQGAIATIGSTEVSPREFTNALQQRRQAISRQLGQPLTAELSRAYGIDAAVLSELVNGAAIANHAKELGLRLSDDTVANLIRTDPNFLGPDQTFSRPLFDERMRQAGYTEARYFDERRAVEVREQLSEALVGGIVAPDAMAGIFHRFREETRTVAFVRLAPSAALKIGEPDEAALKALYEEQKRAFTVPERRKIAVLIASSEALKERSKVTDAEVRANWEQARATWDVPERRRLQQISFRTKPEAEAEAKAIEGGKSFLLAALEANGSQGRLDQGLIARREIADVNFAKTAFELELNKLSEPVPVRGGFVILRVTEVAPARERPFEEVAAEVRQALEDNKLRDIASKLHDEIEDRRGATDSSEKLKKIGADLKMTVIEAESIDAQGLGADGKPALAHPDSERLIASAFDGDKDLPRESLQLTDGGEAWVEVVGVTPSLTRPFEEVKAEVEKLWRDREVQQALTKQGQALTERIKTGATLEAIAKELELKVETTAPFKRAAPPEGFTPGATRLAFTLPKGGAASAASGDPKSRLLMVVTEIKAAEPPSKGQADALKQELVQELQRDAMQTYVTALRARQAVTINDAVYRRAVGLDQGQ